jgi:hypothetical protein
MKRHALAVALSVAISVAWMSLAAKAQQAEKVPRLGWEQGDVSTASGARHSRRVAYDLS